MKILYFIMCSQILIQNTFTFLKPKDNSTETEGANNVQNDSTEGVETASASLVCYFVYYNVNHF